MSLIEHLIAYAIGSGIGILAAMGLIGVVAKIKEHFK